MPFRVTHRIATPVLGAAALLAALGCAAPTSPHANRTDNALPEPTPAGPLGRPAAQGTRPSDRPDAIVISNPDVAVRHWATPTIIDTRSFDVQIQVKDPWQGPIDTIKPHLPKHHRDKTLPQTAPSSAPEGTTFRGSRATAGISFPAITQTGWNPPDPTLAVGPNHIVQTVNSLIAFFDKDGNMQFSRQLGNAGNPGFFEPEGAGGFAFDPKCLYDPETGRFIVVVLETYGNNESWIDIAVSDDSDPNGVWYRYRTNSVIQVGNNEFWVDYPGLGFDDNAFYITGNLFKLNGPDDNGFAGALFRVFDKEPLINGDPVQIADLVPNFSGSVQVAQSYGDADRCYFLSRESNASVRLWTINDPLTNPSLQSTTISHANASSPNNGAPNLNGGTLDVLDGRFMNVHWRDGNLYTAHGISSNGGRNRARWYHFATNNWPDQPNEPTLVEQGNIMGTGTQHYFYPAIASDNQNNVGLVMAYSSADEYAGVRIAGRASTDTPGTMSEPESVAVGSSGTDGRWGDYFDLTVDPNDDSTLWYVGMYAQNSGWQTVIGSFSLIPPCPGDFSGDGDLDIFDVFLFLGLYHDHDPVADLHPDGIYDIFDVFAYLEIYNAGCPK